MIQIARQNGAETCEKDNKDENKKVNGRFIVASKDNYNQTNFEYLKELDLDIVEKTIENHLKEEKYKDDFAKKLNGFNEAKSKIIIENVDKHINNQIFLFSGTNLDSKKCNDIYSELESGANIETISKSVDISNFILWNEFCHIEEFSEYSEYKLLEKMNRMYITEKDFDEKNDILCFINTEVNMKNEFKYKKIHLCENYIDL